jgi:hypothetical protein
LQLEYEALRTRHENNVNFYEFSIVLQLALFEFDERIVGSKIESVDMNLKQKSSSKKITRNSAAQLLKL